MKPYYTLQMKWKHPWMNWRQAWDASGPDWLPVDWDQIWYGLIMIVLCLFILSQALRDNPKDWVCARAKFEAVWVKDVLYPATPCTEELNLITGETRQITR